MEARLLAGGSGYDIVSASTDYFSREIKAGVYETLDKSKLPNWKNLDPAYSRDPVRLRSGQRPRRALSAFHQRLRLQRRHGQGAHAECAGRQSRHAVQAGSRVQVRRLRRDLPRLRGGCDPARPQLPAASIRTPRSARTSRRREDMLLKVRPYVRSFDSAEYLNGLANQEMCVAMSWSSDYAMSHARAKAVGVNVNLAFTRAEGGRQRDVLIAPHPGGCASPRGRLSIHQFHPAAGRDCRNHQRDLLRQR